MTIEEMEKRIEEAHRVERESQRRDVYEIIIKPIADSLEGA